MRTCVDHDRHRGVAERRARAWRAARRATCCATTARGTRQLQARLQRARSASALARVAHRLALAQRALHAVSPLATLSRGFAIVTRADGSVLTDAAAVAPGEQIEARLARGSLAARVTGRKE